MGAFATSAISFGSYSFPASFGLVKRDQPSTIDEVKIPYLDGSNAPAGTRGSKIISIAGTIGGAGAVDSSGNYITTRDQAENELNLMSSWLESGYQSLNVGATPARSIMAQKKTSTFTYVPQSNQCAIEVAIDFLAQDPRWLAAAATTLGPSATISSSPTVNGSAITYPVFTFVGAYVNPTIKIVPAGGTGYIQLALTYSMGAGDTLVVDCNPRNRANGVLLNGTARLDLIGTSGSTNTNGDSAFFPYIQPGVNAITASGSSNGTSVTVSWNEAYLF